jgi:Uma2 family endonuclease
MAISYAWFDAFPDQITAEDYAEMPAELSRSIEVIDGHIVKCESPSRVHNRVAFNMAAVLKEGRKPTPCLMVEADVDVRIIDVPLNDVVLVVEIVSPESSLKTDTVDKKAVYADAGIPIYLIVFLNAAQDAVEKIEEYWLEPTGVYRLVQLHTRRLIINTPVPVDVSLDRLTLI